MGYVVQWSFFLLRTCLFLTFCIFGGRPTGMIKNPQSHIRCSMVFAICVKNTEKTIVTGNCPDSSKTFLNLDIPSNDQEEALFFRKHLGRNGKTL